MTPTCIRNSRGDLIGRVNRVSSTLTVAVPENGAGAVGFGNELEAARYLRTLDHFRRAAMPPRRASDLQEAP